MIENGYILFEITNTTTRIILQNTILFRHNGIRQHGKRQISFDITWCWFS